MNFAERRAATTDSDAADVREKRIAAIFSINNLDVSRFGRRVISKLDLAAPAPGSLALIGPGGAGKSSLLLAVVAQHERAADLQMSGCISLNDQPTHALGDELGWYAQWRDVSPEAPSALRATHRSVEEQRALSCERLESLSEFLAVPRRIYVLDEPTAQLGVEDAQRARELIAAKTADAFVLLATHNREDCLVLDGHMAIIAGGEVLEAGPSRELLSHPHTEDGRRWLETGYVPRSVPLPQANLSDGMWWVVPGLLCGLSRPGLITSATRQYQRLADAGVRHLVCLEEVEPSPKSESATFGLERHFVPIPDMAAPTFEQATAFCRLTESAIARNEGVAFHCKGGLGRTGTAIAATLIWHGDSAESAINSVRSAQRLAIQSQEQLDFLRRFSHCLRNEPLSAAPNPQQ